MGWRPPFQRCLWITSDRSFFRCFFNETMRLNFLHCGDLQPKNHMAEKMKESITIQGKFQTTNCSTNSDAFFRASVVKVRHVTVNEEMPSTKDHHRVGQRAVRLMNFRKSASRLAALSTQQILNYFSRFPDSPLQKAICRIRSNISCSSTFFTFFPDQLLRTKIQTVILTMVILRRRKFSSAQRDPDDIQVRGVSRNLLNRRATFSQQSIRLMLRCRKT